MIQKRNRSLDKNVHSEGTFRICRSLRQLFQERTFQNHLRLTHRIGEVESMIKKGDPAAADLRLGFLFRDLEQAPDGEGSVILNAERYCKYFPARK
jgi:hypothetical protein